MAIVKNKAIILCGGLGTRLGKNTSVIPKSLLPVYDKPMLYYPLNEIDNLEFIDEIIIITTPSSAQLFKDQLSGYEKKLTFLTQDNPTGGILESLIISDNIIKNCNVWLFLGDNVFIPNLIKTFCTDCISNKKLDCLLFTKRVEDWQNYGILVKNLDNSFNKVIEKPDKFVGKQAVVGVYYFSKNTLKHINSVERSHRGQLEITDFINLIIKDRDLSCDNIEIDNIEWLDAGTPDRLLDAANKVKKYNTI